jgi:4a-hydroxytetrahydrobiopterin dehydratase
MSELAQKKGTDGEGAVLKGARLQELSKKLGGNWQVQNEHHLEKEWKFKDFKEALAFTNKIGELAERIGHHPDIYLTWGQVKVTIWTHSKGGLTESDFVLAAKIDELG